MRRQFFFKPRSPAKGFLLFITLYFMCLPSFGETDIQKSNLRFVVQAVRDGQPLKELNRGDLRIKIKGCSVIIEDIQAESRRLKPRNPQCPACLIFFVNTSQPDDRVEQIISQTFETIIQEGDDVILCINEYIQPFHNLKNKGHALSEAIALLRKESLRAQRHRDSYMTICPRLIREIITEYSEVTQFVHPHYHMKLFNRSLNRYLGALQEFKESFLLPKMRSYHRISNFLDGPVQKPVWMFSVHQMTDVPSLSSQDRSRIIKIIDSLDRTAQAHQEGVGANYDDMIAFSKLIWKKIQDIDQVFSLKTEWPVEEVSQMAIQKQATIHSFFLPVEKREPTKSEKSQEKISSDIRLLLGEISTKTGGICSDGPDILNGLKELGQKENVFHIISCSLSGRPRSDSLEIDIPDKSVELFYNPHIRPQGFTEMTGNEAGPIPHIHFQEISYKNGTLHLRIDGFFMNSILGLDSGEIQVRVTVQDRDKRSLFDQTKSLFPEQGDVKVDIDFGWLEKGPFLVTVDAEDLISGNRCQEELFVRNQLGFLIPQDRSALSIPPLS